MLEWQPKQVRIFCYIIVDNMIYWSQDIAYGTSYVFPCTCTEVGSGPNASRVSLESLCEVVWDGAGGRFHCLCELQSRLRHRMKDTSVITKLTTPKATVDSKTSYKELYQRRYTAVPLQNFTFHCAPPPNQWTLPRHSWRTLTVTWHTGHDQHSF